MITLRKFAVAAALVVCSFSASAATTWALTNSAANEPLVTGWRASGNTTTLATTTVGYWGGSGIGIGPEGSPEHSLDNANGYEVAVLSFDDLVRLDTVKAGWWSNDSDIFVMAYTGVGTPTTTSLQNLTSSGWTLVGNYSNIGTTTVQLGAAENLYSSFWLIGAGGFQTGVGVVNDSTTTQSCSAYYWNGSCKTWTTTTTPKYDYVKIAAVGGVTKPDTPPGKVSEPGLLGLLGIGLVGLFGLQRRRAR